MIKYMIQVMLYVIQRVVYVISIDFQRANLAKVSNMIRAKKFDAYAAMLV